MGGVRDLLRDAERVLPGIAEYALVETAAGLRPGSPDNLPLIGALGPDGLLVATGHHRNGMLLAPLTADAVAGAAAPATRCPAPVRAADPRRFAVASQQGGSTVQVWINGDAARAGRRGRRVRRRARRARGARAPASRWRWTARSCRRADWARTALADGARVEVLTAVQGG